jgi:glucose-1-phosphate thymidylyltransferase
MREWRSLTCTHLAEVAFWRKSLVDKAVILAAGSASRMQENLDRYISNEEELTFVQKGEKMAARFAQFPFLDYQMLNLIQAGIKKINLVLRHDDSYFINHYDSRGTLLFPEALISYSFQEIPDGTAHAVLIAEKFVDGDKFIILNGDNNYSTHSILMLVSSPAPQSSMVAYDIRGFNKWTREKLKTFAVVKTREGKLEKIVEKPQNPHDFKTNDMLYTVNNQRIEIRNRILVSMNLWCIGAEIVEVCRTVKRHEPRKDGKPGEYELPDAIELFMNKGNEILVYHACEDVLDLTKAEDIEIVAGRIRKNLMEKIKELERRYKRLP